MKYIKKFEFSATEDELSRVGNYVIINPDKIWGGAKDKKFFNNNIGQIIKIEENPLSKENTFRIQYNKEDIPTYIILNRDNTFLAKNYEIVLEYKNKEDLEAFIASKKYNL